VGGECLEAVSDVGLEGVEREELVVLRGVEGGDGGGAAAEAKHAEEARPGGRRRLGGGHGLIGLGFGLCRAWALGFVGGVVVAGEQRGGERMVGSRGDVDSWFSPRAMAVDRADGVMLFGSNQQKSKRQNFYHLDPNTPNGKIFATFGKWQKFYPFAILLYGSKQHLNQ
jgi:hypothetical protein